jgi:pimeloyl-ACP methyl ester carboxylesterase
MAPPLVLIHGAFCGGWAMTKLAHAFEAAGHRTRTPTLRHHPPPRQPRDLARLGTTSMTDYAADIEALIAGLGEPPVLIGHSIGGLIAQMVSAQSRVRALVLLAPSAPWGVLPSHWNEIASGFGLYMVNGNYWEQALIPVYEIAAGHTLSRLPEPERRAAFAQMVPESGRAVFETLHWWLDITCPVLCIAGGADAVNPPETVRRIAARYRSGATFRVYDEMGHWLIGEPGWERIAADALAWLESSVVG